MLVHKYNGTQYIVMAKIQANLYYFLRRGYICILHTDL